MAKTKIEKIASIEEEIKQLENKKKRLIQEQKEQERNPYCFSVGGVGVKIEFAEGGPSLQETLAAFLIRQKSGL